MNVQPWVAIAGVLAGLAMGAGGATWHWTRRLSLAQRSSDRLHASRDLLDQQNTQARRQIEQLQTEMNELRQVADRARRRLAAAAPQAAAAAAPAPVATPPAPARPSPQEVAQLLAQNDQRRAQQRLPRHLQDDAGFEPTKPM